MKNAWVVHKPLLLWLTKHFKHFSAQVDWIYLGFWNLVSLDHWHFNFQVEQLLSDICSQLFRLNSYFSSLLTKVSLLSHCEASWSASFSSETKEAISFSLLDWFPWVLINIADYWMESKSHNSSWLQTHQLNHRIHLKRNYQSHSPKSSHSHERN